MDNSDTATRVDAFLAHYGVKGMRWGVRKRSGGGSSGAESNKKSSTEDGAGKGASDSSGRLRPGAGSQAKSKTRALTDDELRQAINRINMERQYEQLTSKSFSSAAKKHVKEVLADVGKQQAKAVLNALITKQLVKAGIVTPKKSKK